MSAYEDHRRQGPARPWLGRAPSARVLVVEDHALMATGLKLALSGRRWDVETTSGHTPADVVDHAGRFQPHGVLLSVRLGGGVDSGIALIEPLVETGAQVLVLTAERRRTVLARFLEAGAAGWVGRDTALDEVDSTLARLVDGRPIIGKTIHASLLAELRLEREREEAARAIFSELTQREAHVLAALTDGLTAEEIARDHFVAVCTVRSQIRGVLQKLDVRSQLAAVALAATHRELLPHRGETSPDRRQPPQRERSADAELTASIA